MSPTEPRYNRIVVIRHTTRFEVMFAFYHEMLAFEVLESWNNPGNQGAVLALPGTGGRYQFEVIHIGQVAQPGVAPANMAVNLYVDDATAWHDRLQAAGVPIARGLQDVPWGLRSFGVDDPEGLRIWFQQELGPAE